MPASTRDALADAGHSCCAWHERRVGSDQTRVFQKLCLFRPAWAPAWVWHAERELGIPDKQQREEASSLSLSLSLLMICSKDDFPFPQNWLLFSTPQQQHLQTIQRNIMEQKGTQGICWVCSIRAVWNHIQGN